MNEKRKARLIAYYLPQFHPIPENDEWWGTGFTEWTNTAKARPLFKGHYQPHVPADLGFYDLRLSESRIQQAEMARSYGIEGFLYWHYWFAGKRLLERPFNEVLKTGEPDFPFALAWANESWTGTWMGCADRFLMEQTYPGRQDYEAHFNFACEAFLDSRYIHVDGKPLFYVYKPENIPEPKRFVECWQELAIKAGLKGIFFVGEDHSLKWDPETCGFDASVPHSPGCIFHLLKLNNRYIETRLRRIFNNRFDGVKHVFSYRDFMQYGLTLLDKDWLQFPSVLPCWDNTPRCGERGYVLLDSEPELFRDYLVRSITKISDRASDKRIVFLKSWNEWAEGNYLEPDLKYGHGFLQACRDAIS